MEERQESAGRADPIGTLGDEFSRGLAECIEQAGRPLADIALGEGVDIIFMGAGLPLRFSEKNPPETSAGDIHVTRPETSGTSSLSVRGTTVP